MNQYIQLAKSAVEKYIKEGEVIQPPQGLPAEFFQKRAGVFVTIENNKQLRGCIGTYLPTKGNIAEEIIFNAISAATKDYRFNSIIKEELLYLSYTVYVLNPPEPIKNTKELNPKKYGVLVKSGMKSGLLLPDLGGVDTIKQQISIACQKAGIDQEIEEITIYKFTVEKYQ